MRITANITADNALYNIQQGRTRLDKLNEQIASGNNVNRPSDDPINSRLLLEIGDKVKTTDQYTSNIDKASTWQQMTNTALTGMSDTMTLAKRLADSITSGSSDPTARQSAHDQLVAMKQQLVDMSNTQSGDQYLFGGASNLTAPFGVKSGNLAAGNSTVSNVDVSGLKSGMPVSGIGIPAGTVVGAIDSVANSFVLVDSSGHFVTASTAVTVASLNFYSGDNAQSSIEIAQNSSQALNVTGDRLLMGSGANPSYGSTDILQAFDNLIAAVGDKNTASDVAGIQAGAQGLEDGAKQINNAQSDVASRLARLDSMKKLNENSRNTLMAVYSSTQNVDYAKLGVELTQQQTAFNASLSATAKISQLSLLDYLK